MHCICILYELMEGWWTYLALKGYLTGIQFSTFHMTVRMNCRCKSVKKKVKNCKICMKGPRRRLTQELNV